MSGNIQTIDTATLAQWIKEGSALIIDVREANERQGGYIPGSTLNALQTFDPGKVPVDPDKHLVLHCQRGIRCGPASQQLSAAGYQGDIFRLSGGFMAWASAGGEIAKGN
jgi:rhodanese-related sulfurtransferase